MRLTPLFLISTTLLVAQEAAPPEPPKLSWSDKASFSLVAVGGNAESQSFGFSNEYAYNWSPATSLAFNSGAVRVSNKTIAYAAQGTSATDFLLVKTESTEVTTEAYFANLRFAHNLPDRLLWFAGGGWERNRPSGLDSRCVVNAGFGYWWVKTDSSKLRTDLGLGYTKEKPVLELPGQLQSYATWNAVLNYEQKIGVASLFASNLTLTDAMKESQKYLAVWRNDLSTNLNKRLALKVGYAMTYNNRPASRGVDIVQTGSEPPVVLGQTSVVLKKLDTIFTASLVITF